MFVLTFVAVIATWVVPAGQYSKLAYDAKTSQLVVTSPQGETKHVEATQQTLNDLGISIKIDQFTSGKISKPISIPGTYESLDSQPASLAKIKKITQN